MFRSSILLLILAVFICSLCSAFSPAKVPVFSSARSVPGACDPKCRFLMHMSEDKNEGEVTEKRVAPTSGTFYDDEVDPIPAQKQGVSDEMKKRLINEATSGLDPDRKQTNVLLYIILGVAVLVVLGGSGILY